MALYRSYYISAIQIQNLLVKIRMQHTIFTFLENNFIKIMTNEYVFTRMESGIVTSFQLATALEIENEQLNYLNEKYSIIYQVR